MVTRRHRSSTCLRVSRSTSWIWSRASPSYGKIRPFSVTFDEGGGYYDSGYVQPLDFFGDGTRIPLLVVSPYSQGGLISHEYSDHVSLLKFIEYNWRLPPVTRRSRDNLPNPITSELNPYVPVNGPAIGSLLSLFDLTIGADLAGAVLQSHTLGR